MNLSSDSMGTVPADAPIAESRPVQENERLDAMDLVRGVAIFGILMVNMQFFSLPFIRAVYPAEYADWSPRETWAYYIVKVLFEYKFVSTFSLLFGAGLVMQFTRAKAAGVGFTARYYRRIALLAVIGLLHALFLWYGDILFIYACVGSVLYFFRNLSPRTLMIVAGILIGVNSLMTVGVTALQQLVEQSEEQVAPADTEPEASDLPDAEAPVAQPLRGFEAMTASEFDITKDVWIEAEMVAYRDGPFADAMLFRTISYVMCLMFTLFGFGWHILAMFLLGTAFMKMGLFHRDRRSLQAKLALAGLAIGLPLESLNGWLVSLSPTDNDGFDLLSALVHAIGSPMLCIGYVASLSWIANGHVGRAMHAPLRAVGRMALTTYLSTTIVVTFLMYHWGLGWFGTVDRFSQFLVALSVYAGLMVFSVAWLAVFRFGPMEWLWRTGTYGRFQPLLR